MSNPRQEVLNTIYTMPLDVWRPQLDTLSRHLSQGSLWRGQAAIYEQPPAPPAEFVTSPLYLGLGARVYPVVLRTLEEVFSGAYNEAAICWGIGSGKSFFSSLAISYLLHRTLCLRDPQGYYGLAPGSAIAFLNMSASAGQAQRVVFNEIKQRVAASPWFRLFCNEHRFGKHALQVLSEEIRLPKHLVVVTGNSAETCPLGYNLLGAVLDEAAFLLTTGDGRRDAAEEIYHALRQRITSRFFDRGLLVLISSPKHVGDFIERKLAEAPDSPRLYTSRRAIWEVKPPHLYCGRCFEYEGLRVPVEYQDDFRRNPQRALRDLAARPTQAYCAWFTDEQALEACCHDGPGNDAVGRGLVPRRSLPPLPQGEGAGGEAPLGRLATDPLDAAGRWRADLRAPDGEPRYLHVDLGLRHDACGLAMVHCRPAPDRPDEPEVWADLVVRLTAPSSPAGREGQGSEASAPPSPAGRGGQGSEVYAPPSPAGRGGQGSEASAPPSPAGRGGQGSEASAPPSPAGRGGQGGEASAPPSPAGRGGQGGEVDFARIRELINDLRRRGYNLAQVSFDGWQSVDSRQILRRQGFRTALVSVDRDLGAYETLKELVNTGRLHLPRYEPLLRELKRLELVDGRKVDHPRGGSKDCADALAAATSEAIKAYGGGRVGGRIV
jgi:hypothetical protein